MTRTFWVEVRVRNEFLRDQPEVARATARAQLELRASRALYGPRGGKYRPIGRPYDFRDSAEPRWMHNEHTFAARVDAKYVRPHR